MQDGRDESALAQDKFWNIFQAFLNLLGLWRKADSQSLGT